MTLLSVLHDLTAAPAPAGFEAAAVEALAAPLKNAGCELRRDRLGSLTAFRRCGAENAPLLMLDAHLDEVGLIVTSVDENGFLKFGSLGGADARVMPDGEVTVLCDPPLDGVLCCLPPHVQTAEEMKSFPAVSDMAIDCGMAKEAVERRVSPGTPVVFKSEPRLLKNGRFVSKALDNRLSAAVVACALERLRGAALDYDIVFCASSMEEVGGRGAQTAAFGLAPNAALVLDVTFAEAKGAPADKTFGLGELTVCVGPECDRRLNAALRQAAEALKIPLRPEVCPRATGTNGTEIQVSRAGVPVAVLSVPIRNMHTPIELASMDTAESAVRLLAKFLTDLKGGDLL